MYRIERYGVTNYGATYYERPLYCHTWLMSKLVSALCGLWWDVEVERAD